MKSYEIIRCGVKEIDKVVKDVISIVDKYGMYAIVSGYFAIFSCRTRPTQDIDVVFVPYGEQHIKDMVNDLMIKGYDVYFDEEGWKKYKDPLYVYTDREIGGYRIYFEIKYPKDEYHWLAVNNRVFIRKQNIGFYFSPPELQIAYKLWLGSDKDVLDAAYIYDVFVDSLDLEILEHFVERLGVKNEFEKIAKSNPRKG